MLIEITQENIDGFEGRKAATGNCRSGSCPVAHAITTATGKPAYVGVLTWNFEEDTGVVLRELPCAVGDWIEDFDSGFHPKPFSFELEVDE